MGSFLKWIGIAFSLLDPVIAAARKLEEVVPEAGKGVAKLQMIKDIFSGVASSIPDEVDQNTLGSVVGVLVNAVVSFFNVTGVFKK